MCAKLLAPHDIDAFFEHHWGQRALYVPGAEHKFAALYDVTGDRWLPHAVELEAATEDASGSQRQQRILPSQIAEHYQAGATLCANVTRDPTLWPTLRAWASELSLPGMPFAKLYASPDGKGFAMHSDAFHVFVCQLVGQKRWRFSSTPAVEAPLWSGKRDASGQPVWCHPLEGVAMCDDAGRPIAPPEDAALEEAWLTPGDLLYLPPGCWHVAQAMGRSVAVSLSPPRTSVYELVSKTLEEHLTLRAAWRRDVLSRDRSKAVPDEVAAVLRERLDELRALLSQFDERALFRVWRMNASAHDIGLAPPEAIVLEDDTQLRVDDAARRHLVAPSEPGGADAIHFYSGGAEWTLPIAARRFVEQLVARPAFSLAEARGFDPSLRDDDVREILTELLSAGLVTIAD